MDLNRQRELREKSVHPMSLERKVFVVRRKLCKSSETLIMIMIIPQIYHNQSKLFHQEVNLIRKN